MKRPWFLFVLGGGVAAVLSGMLIVRAADGPSSEPQLTISHPECDYFGGQREKFTEAALSKSRPRFALSARTQQVRAMMAAPADSRTNSFSQAHAAGTIDSYIEADFNANGITPAGWTANELLPRSPGAATVQAAAP